MDENKKDFKIRELINYSSSLYYDQGVEFQNKSLQKESSPLIDGLKSLWNEKEIDIIYGLLNHIDDKKDLEKNVYLKNIDF